MVNAGFESGGNARRDARPDNRPDASLYTVGGTVQANEGGLYISRQADGELLQLCEDSTFAYVLTPRQMGKSSLMIRTAEQLIDDGRQAVIVDLTQLGTQLSADEWYSDFLDLVAGQLMLATDVKRWWRENAQSGLTLRLTRFFQEVVLAEVAEPVVVFVDEIDTTLSLAFTDDFYAAIRYLYVARSTDSRLRRLSFVLIGVATPADLIRDPKRTPFNIGERVDVTDFTPQEALPLVAGLGLPTEKEQQMLDGVLAWTGGHPYLTQRLCRSLVEQPSQGWTAAAVEPVVAETFLGRMSEQDNNLLFVRDMLTERAPKPFKQEVLTTYREIYRARQPVLDEEQNLVKSHLKLSGVVRREGKHLQVRNQIYQEVFGEQWIREHLPESFWQRNKSVLKVAIPVTAASVLAAVGMTGLYAEALQQRRRANVQAILAKTSEQKALEALEEVHGANQKVTNALKEANEQKKRAEQQTDIAQEQRLQAETAQQAEAEQRQRAEGALKRAEAGEAEARQQTEIAEAQTLIAEEQTLIAQDQTNEANQAKAQAEKESINSEIVAQSLITDNLLPSKFGLEALVNGLATAREVQTIQQRDPEIVQPETKMRVTASLRQVVYDIKQKNQLEGHTSAVFDVRFSPDGQTLASASDDGTVRLWNFDLNDLTNKEIRTNS